VANGASTSLNWTRSTPFPEPRAGCAVGLLNGKYVVVGGSYWEGIKGNWTMKHFTSAAHAFDPLTNEWQKLPECPITLGYAAHTVINDKMFVIGGYTGLGGNRKILTLEQRGERYVWEHFADIPENRLFSVALGIGTELFLLGGAKEFEPYDPIGTCCTTLTATNSLWALDIKHPEKGWRELPSHPGSGRWMFTAETDGKSIWMFGGSFQTEKEAEFEYFNEVLQYSIAESAWKRVARLPTESTTVLPLVSVYVDGKIILISREKRVWEMDLTTLKYVELESVPEAAFVDKFVYSKGMLIGAGGENAVEGPRRRSDWTFLAKVSHK
jgi:hypothetical protein